MRRLRFSFSRGRNTVRMGFGVQVLLQLPCYDLTPVIALTLGATLLAVRLCDFGYGQLP